jgi:hypothetical protein
MCKKGDAQLLLALLAGASIDDAAQQAGLSKTTAWRRRQEPEFVEQLEAMRADLIQRSADMLTSANIEAITTLRSMLSNTPPVNQKGKSKDSPWAPPADQQRVASAKAIIELGIRMRENVELKKQVAELKKLVELSKAESADDSIAPESHGPG